MATATRPTMRVKVEGIADPIEDVGSLVAQLTFENDSAEVQIGRLGDRIVVVAAGDIEHRTDERGFHYLSVFPTSPPETVRPTDKPTNAATT